MNRLMFLNYFKQKGSKNVLLIKKWINVLIYLDNAKFWERHLGYSWLLLVNRGLIPLYNSQHFHLSVSRVAPVWTHRTQSQDPGRLKIFIFRYNVYKYYINYRDLWTGWNNWGKVDKCGMWGKEMPENLKVSQYT